MKTSLYTNNRIGMMLLSRANAIYLAVVAQVISHSPQMNTEIRLIAQEFYLNIISKLRNARLCSRSYRRYLSHATCSDHQAQGQQPLIRFMVKRIERTKSFYRDMAR